MKRAWLKLETLSNIVISRDAGTSLGHETLDYIPGSALLGATIAAMGFKAQTFLSGDLRFGDALPVVNGEVAWPMPLSYHYPKLMGKNGELVNGLEDMQQAALRDSVSPQMEQHRDGYATVTGKRYEVPREYRLKTAMNRDSMGRAADAKLFGYEAIRKGQTFVARVTALDQVTLDATVKALTGRPLRIGRSRSAEYGSVTVKLCAQPQMPETPSDNCTVLYLASDLILTRDGMPVLQPTAKDFGLPEKTDIDWKRTFLRTRSYSPWNAFYNRRMTERQVIGRGSVITIPGTGVATEEMIANLQHGVGNAVEEGCGVVLVNPSFVVSPPKQLHLVPPTRHEQPTSVRSSPKKAPTGDLVEYILSRHRLVVIEPEALSDGRTWAREFMAHQGKLERDFDNVPGKSQWAAIRGFAASARDDLHVLDTKLKEYCTKDMRRQLWFEQTARMGGEWTSLYGLICSKTGLDPDPGKNQLQGAKNGRAVRSLYHAALEMSRDLGRKAKATAGHDKTKEGVAP